MKKSEFQNLVGQEFKISFSPDHIYTFTLSRLIEGRKVEELNLEPFTLEFKGDLENMVFKQGMYNVFHESMGDLQLFLIPRQPDKDGIYYQSIFS